MRRFRTIFFLACLVWVNTVCASFLQDSTTRTSTEPERSLDVPYVPTAPEIVAAMLRLANVNSTDILFDLGCGDGRIVVTAAQKYGTYGTGVDLNPQRIKEAEANAALAKVQDRVRFLQQDLFTTDLRSATVVTLYLLPSVNLRLRPTLLRDLRPGTRVVSHAFNMGEWLPDRIEQVHGATIYLWIVPAQVAGTWTWRASDATGEQTYKLRLNQQFQHLTGELTVNEVYTPLTKVALQGKQIQFTAVPRVNGKPVTLTFNGALDGDSLVGHVGTNEAMTENVQPWLARRMPHVVRTQG